MPVAVPDLRLSVRSRFWKWGVCGLLLLATMVNYMDRLTLNLLAPRIKDEMKLNAIDYGRVESGFAVAFAVGAVVVGWLADRGNVYWVYPAAVLVWSAAGFLTGYAETFVWLFACRFLLGLAESGNWPCALRTTQHVLPPSERTMGNSILQSGAAFGAIIIPVVVYWTVDPRQFGSWRLPFLVVGASGATWVILWMVGLRPRDFRGPGEARPVQAVRPRVGGWLAFRRLCALVILVVMINATWHFFRVWLSPLMAQLGYDEPQRNLFMSAYYVAASLGSLSAGFATLLLTRGGWSVHVSRLIVFFAYGLLAGLAVWAAFLPAGPLLLGLLLVVAFGSLGVFPAYYSFSQELTVQHQGKLTGLLSCLCWLALAAWQELIGHVVEYTKSYTACMIAAGMLPLAAFAALMLLWGRDEARVPLPIPEAAPAVDDPLAPSPTGVQPAGSVSVRP
jgi:MFS transporter, ACS family, aldohexuronate transporter